MAKQPDPLPDDVLDYFRTHGAKGGRKSAAALTRAQRIERATKASKAAAAVRTRKAKAKKAKP